MKITSNLFGFHNEFGLKKSIDIFSEAGFEGIDFCADIKEYYTDLHDEAFYREIKQYAGDRNIVFPQSHAPYESSFSDSEESEKRFGEIVKSIENSSLLGVETVVVHPCRHIYYKENDNYDFMMQYNLDFYKRLIPYAERCGVRIAIENIRISVTETPEGLLELIKSLDNDVFTVCFDVGHANMCVENPADMIRKVGRYINCTHIHDNDRSDDCHTLPFYGNIDWEEVMKAFAEAGYEGNLNYEAGLFLKRVPAELRCDAAKFMVKTGKCLAKWYHDFNRRCLE